MCPQVPGPQVLGAAATCGGQRRGGDGRPAGHQPHSQREDRVSRWLRRGTVEALYRRQWKQDKPAACVLKVTNVENWSHLGSLGSYFPLVLMSWQRDKALLFLFGEVFIVFRTRNRVKNIQNACLTNNWVNQLQSNAVSLSPGGQTVQWDFPSTSIFLTEIWTITNFWLW